jgi:hypothetical protein
MERPPASVRNRASRGIVIGFIVAKRLCDRRELVVDRAGEASVSFDL